MYIGLQYRDVSQFVVCLQYRDVTVSLLCVYSIEM